MGSAGRSVANGSSSWPRLDRAASTALVDRPDYSASMPQLPANRSYRSRASVLLGPQRVCQIDTRSLDRRPDADGQRQTENRERYDAEGCRIERLDAE